MTAQTTIISNEDEAWDILRRWMDKEDIGEVEFKDWPVLSINIKGEDYSSSLNSSQMAALIEFRKTIGRAYAVVAHGSYDMRRLKIDEEEQLEFSTTIKRGSSITDTDLSPLVQAFASVVTANPTSSLIAGVIIGLALVARPVILKHYENRAKQIEASERKKLVHLALSSDERAKYSLFDQALKRLERFHPQISKAVPDASSGFWRFASASTNADEMTVAGISLQQRDLEVLSERRQKRDSDITEVEQVFEVIGINKQQNVYRVQLHSQNLALTAAYKWPQMTDAKIKKLMSHMTNSKKILAKLEIKVIDKSQVTGRLIRFKTFSQN